MFTGKIKTLFTSVEKDEALFPRTKTKAVSDDNGVGLDALLSEINTELDGKAPAGYGLGTNGTLVNEIDNLFGTGVYIWEDSIQNPFRAGLCLHIERFASGSYATQYCFRSDTYAPIMCVRNKAEGIWGEWEWVNPPMMPGVEYRTTERSNEQPVYAKRVSYTTIAPISPTSSVRDLSIPHGISGLSKLLCCKGRISNIYLFPFIELSGGITVIKGADSENITIRIANAPWTQESTFEFDLYYTK